MLNKALVLTALLLFAVPAAAQPVISGVLGKCATGDTVTIVGSGFGTKSPALPVLWDDFEVGNLGSDVARPRLGSYGQSAAVYTGAESYSGLQGADSFRGTSGDVGFASDWIPIDVRNGFASMKIKFVGNYLPSNIKFIRLNSPESNGDYAHGWPNYDMGKDRNVTSFSAIINHGTPQQVYAGGISGLTDGWNSISMWDHLGDPGVANGSVGRNFNNSVFERSDVLTNLSTYPTSNPSHPGLRAAFFCGYASYEGSTYHIYFDEMYADTTLARVFGYNDNPVVYESMFLPVYWSADGDTIRAIFNQGTANQGEDLKVVVVDAAGRFSNAVTVEVEGIITTPQGPGAPGTPALIDSTLSR